MDEKDNITHAWIAASVKLQENTQNMQSALRRLEAARNELGNTQNERTASAASCPLREDVAEASLLRETVLANAPQAVDGQLVLPRVVAEE